MRLLWTGADEGVSFHGKFFAFDNLVQFPRPHGGATLPIHIGGSSRAAARRTGLRGDGYFAGGALLPDERMSQWEPARETAIQAGRDPERLEHTRWSGFDMTDERIVAFTAQGVDRVVMSAGSTDPNEQRDELSRFAERFLTIHR